MVWDILLLLALSIYRDLAQVGMTQDLHNTLYFHMQGTALVPIRWMAPEVSLEDSQQRQMRAHMVSHCGRYSYFDNNLMKRWMMKILCTVHKNHNEEIILKSHHLLQMRCLTSWRTVGCMTQNKDLTLEQCMTNYSISTYKCKIVIIINIAFIITNNIKVLALINYQWELARLINSWQTPVHNNLYIFALNFFQCNNCLVSSFFWRFLNV